MMVYKITLDGSQFVDHNDSKMCANYWSPAGVPCLTAREAKMWPENNTLQIYMMGDDNFNEFFAEM